MEAVKSKSKRKSKSAKKEAKEVVKPTVDSVELREIASTSATDDDSKLEDATRIDTAIDDIVARAVALDDIATSSDASKVTSVRSEVDEPKVETTSANTTEKDETTASSTNKTSENKSLNDKAIQESLSDPPPVPAHAVADSRADSVAADDSLADVPNFGEMSDPSLTQSSSGPLRPDKAFQLWGQPTPGPSRQRPTDYPIVPRPVGRRITEQLSTNDSEEKNAGAVVHETSSSTWASNNPRTGVLVNLDASTTAVDTPAEEINDDVNRQVSLGRRISNWFPKMCACVDADPPFSEEGYPSERQRRRYHRLSTGSGRFHFTELMHRTRRRNEETDAERQAELAFHNVDLTWVRVTVEKNLRTVDLCEILKVKNNTSGNAWAVQECWPELGIERTLEDHEDILAVHREMEAFASNHERNFAFRVDFYKYAFFIDPEPYFPYDMLADMGDGGGLCNIGETIKSYFIRHSECPIVFSIVWIRDEEGGTWTKTYLVLKGRKLYTTKKPSFPSVKTVRSRAAAAKRAKAMGSRPSLDHRSIGPEPGTSSGADSVILSASILEPPCTFPIETASTGSRRQTDSEPAVVFLHLSDFHIYRSWAGKKYFDAPFDWVLCLRPSTKAEAEDIDAGLPGLKVIAFSSDKGRNCWLTAMRLAKYGKQLRENYRAFKNKRDQNSSTNPADNLNSHNVPNESLRSRVAMDFTGSTGRIIVDPKEARAVAEREGTHWRKSWRPMTRTPPNCAMVRLHGTADGGVHILQPWFHNGLNRDAAAAVLRENAPNDGVFLVRDSKSNPGAYVITYKFNGKIFHAQIQPMWDNIKQCWIFTLDKGNTKFYDLLQLIEFYQLNAGTLQVNLSQYVTSNVRAEAQSPEDGAASPSPPVSDTRNSTSPRSPLSRGTPTAPTSPTNPSPRLTPTSPTHTTHRLTPTSPANRPNRLSPTSPPALPMRRSPTNQTSSGMSGMSSTSASGSARNDGQPKSSDGNGSTAL